MNKTSSGTKLYQYNRSRKQIITSLADKFGLSGNYKDRMKAEGISLIISRHVRYHKDVNNDDSESFNYTTVSSKLIRSDIFPQKIENLMNKVTGVGNFMYITCIVYSRKVVGQYYQRRDLGLDDHDIYYRHLMKYLSDKSLYFDYQPFVLNIDELKSHVQNESNWLKTLNGMELSLVGVHVLVEVCISHHSFPKYIY